MKHELSEATELTLCSMHPAAYLFCTLKYASYHCCAPLGGNYPEVHDLALGVYAPLLLIMHAATTEVEITNLHSAFTKN